MTSKRPLHTLNLFAATMTLFGVVAANAAHAAPWSDPDIASIRVDYRDLNPNTASGAQALLARIGRAAQGICRTELSSASADLDDLRKRCAQDVVDRAVSQAGFPLLVAANGARGQSRSKPIRSAAR